MCSQISWSELVVVIVQIVSFYGLLNSERKSEIRQSHVCQGVCSESKRKADRGQLNWAVAN